MPLPISIRCRETAGFGAYSRVRSAMISRRDTPAAPSRGGTKKTTASQAKGDDGREIAERLPRSPPPANLVVHQVFGCTGISSHQGDWSASMSRDLREREFQDQRRECHFLNVTQPILYVFRTSNHGRDGDRLFAIAVISDIPSSRILLPIMLTEINPLSPPSSADIAVFTVVSCSWARNSGSNDMTFLLCDGMEIPETLFCSAPGTKVLDACLDGIARARPCGVT